MASHSSVPGPCYFFTSWRSTSLIVGIIPSVPVLETHRWSSQQAHPHQIMDSFGSDPIEAQLLGVHLMRPNRSTVTRSSPHADQSKHSNSEFTTCEPIEAQLLGVHHMRTNRSTCRKGTHAGKTVVERAPMCSRTHKRSTKQPHNQHVCLRGSLRCKVQVAHAGGEWSELHCRRVRELAFSAAA